MRLTIVAVVCAFMAALAAAPAEARRYIDEHGNWTNKKPASFTAYGKSIPRKKIKYDGTEKPGTIVVNTAERRLYLILDNGYAMRYGVGVGRAGFEWSGTHRITRKAEWPGWTPPARMRAREAAKGRILPAYMPGGINNPLGARALYIGSTIYRIHGTNNPKSIGHAMSSGCIRMMNDDVIDLSERTDIGAKVIVKH